MKSPSERQVPKSNHGLDLKIWIPQDTTDVSMLCVRHQRLQCQPPGISASEHMAHPHSQRGCAEHQDSRESDCEIVLTPNLESVLVLQGALKSHLSQQEGAD